MLEPIKPPQQNTPPVIQQPITPPQQQQYTNATPVNNSWNIASVVAVAAALTTFILFITFPIAIIAGHIGLSQVKKTGQKGKALAITGVVVGWLYFIGVLFIIPAVLKSAGVI